MQPGTGGIDTNNELHLYLLRCLREFMYKTNNERFMDVN